MPAAKGGRGGSGRGNRKPVEYREAAGTARRDQDATNPPVLKAGIPLPPPDFDEEHIRQWFYLADLIGLMNIATEKDAASLKDFVCIHVAKDRLRRDMDRLGWPVTYETEGGVIKMYPQWSAIGELEKRALAYYARYGMTPADRTRVSQIGSPKRRNDFEDM